MSKKESNVHNSYSTLSEVKLVTIGLASPALIKDWAEKIIPTGKESSYKFVGEVLNANTVHYKTFKPHKGGLFCERIFGPIKDFECACGKPLKLKKMDRKEKSPLIDKLIDIWSKSPSIEPKVNLNKAAIKTDETGRKIFSRRNYCNICGVEYTWSVIRRYQLGYIRLISPVTHVWYLKGSPSYLSILLNIKKRDLEQIVYCSQTTTLENSLKGEKVHLKPSDIISSWKKIKEQIINEKINPSSRFDKKKSELELLKEVTRKKKERMKLKLKKSNYWKLFYFSDNDSNISESIEIISTLKEDIQINNKNHKNFLEKSNELIEEHYEENNILLMETSQSKLKQYAKKINLKIINNLSIKIMETEKKSNVNLKQIKKVFKKLLIPAYILLNLSLFSQKSIYKNSLDQTWDKIKENALQKALFNFSNRSKCLNSNWDSQIEPIFSELNRSNNDPKMNSVFSFIKKMIIQSLIKNETEQNDLFFEKKGNFKNSQFIYNLLINLFKIDEIPSTSVDIQGNSINENKEQNNKKMIEYHLLKSLKLDHSLESVKKGFYNLFFSFHLNSKMSNFKRIPYSPFNKEFFIHSHFNYIEFYTLSNFPPKICNFIISDFYVKAPFFLNLNGLKFYPNLVETLTAHFLKKLLQVDAEIFEKNISINYFTNKMINRLTQIRKVKNKQDLKNLMNNNSQINFNSIRNQIINDNKKLIDISTKTSGESYGQSKQLDSIFYKLSFESNPISYYSNPVNSKITNNFKYISAKRLKSLDKSTTSLALFKKAVLSIMKKPERLESLNFLLHKGLKHPLIPMPKRIMWDLEPKKINKKLNTLNKKLYNNFYFIKSKLDENKKKKDFGSYHCIWESANQWNSFYYQFSGSSETALTFIPDYKKHSFNLKNKAFCSGPGLVKLLVDEYNYDALQKLDRQNRLTYYIIIKDIYRTKQAIREVYYLSKLRKKRDKKLKKLYKAKEDLLRRSKLIRKLCRKKSLPTNTVLTFLPVLPPDLRPIVKMGDQIAASDLNRLYQRVIYRNDRLKKFLKDPTTSYSFEMKYAQRLLQEAVDNLIQNGKSGVISEKDSRGRALKSLSDILKGKQGRFRQYLLGKRVDYSGRSVIVVGPKLKLHECGIPKEMALELYLPFLLKTILNENLARTVIGAKTLIKTNPNLIWELLREIMKTCPVLLNRAPTLHRLGIQAFQPKLIDGRAILLHPLVCSAFNADFDGDQMAVHIPITVEARSEAWKLMLSRNNLLSPATGEPLAIPSQDMVLGCYYLTTNLLNSSALNSTKGNNPLNIKGSGLYFSSIQDVLKNYQLNKIDLHANIWLKWNGFIENGSDLEEPIEIRLDKIGNWKEIYNKSHKNYNSKNILCSNYILTTPGKILFNQIIQKISA